VVRHIDSISDGGLRPAQICIWNANLQDGKRVSEAYVIHTGDLRLPLRPGIVAVPFREM
jgi:hypothetical protein